MILIYIQEGMGQLRIVPGGLQLIGQALVLDSLFASSIKSRRGQPISIESSRNFTVSTRDALGMLQSRLFLGMSVKYILFTCLIWTTSTKTYVLIENIKRIRKELFIFITL